VLKIYMFLFCLLYAFGSVVREYDLVWLCLHSNKLLLFLSALEDDRSGGKGGNDKNIDFLFGGADVLPFVH